MLNSHSDHVNNASHPLIELRIKDLRALNLPKLKKKPFGVRPLRLVCEVSGDSTASQKTEWKEHAEEMIWPDAKMTILARSSDKIVFRVYAKHRSSEHEEVQLNLPLTSIESLIRAVDPQICLNSAPNLDSNVKPCTVNFAFEILNRPLESGALAILRTEEDSRTFQRQKLRGVREIFKQLLDIGTAISEIDPFVKTGFACVNVLVKVFDKPFQIDAKVSELLDAMESTLQRVIEADSHAAYGSNAPDQRNITRILQQINECLSFLNTYTRSAYWNITVRGLGQDYFSIIDNFITNLTRMNDEFDTTRRIVTEALVFRTMESIGKLDTKFELNTLKITEGADYNPDKACLPGTQMDTLEIIRSWIAGEGEHADTQAFLILGQAGVGKSAILHRIAEEYNVTQRLAASFCFSKDRGSTNFFHTIACSLAALDPAFASAVAAASTRDPSLKSTTVITSQIKYLLKEPFQSLSILGTIIIVIDALDECYEGRDELVQRLHEHIPSFPKNIRFVITSRPSEAEDLSRLPWVKTYLLNTATEIDLRTFVKHRLTEYNTGRLLPGFGEREIQAIVLAAEGLFQHANVVCQEIKGAAEDLWRDPSVVFTNLVTSGSRGLDSLYSRILSNAYGVSLDGESGQVVLNRLIHFREVMGWIVYSRTRLSRRILLDFESANTGSSVSSDPDMKGKTYGPVSAILKPLAALLSGTQDDSKNVYPLHSSFRDFVTDETRSGQFYVGSETAHHTHFASTSLKVMERGLHFNMANLESSYVLNHDIVDFSARVDAGISRALSYACINWAWHLETSRITENDFACIEMLSDFLQVSFLFWLEALALEKQTSEAILAHTFLIDWLKTPSIRTNAFQWTALLHNFRLIAEDITPHLYVSGLAWCPIQSSRNKKLFRGLLSLPEGHLLHHFNGFSGPMFGHTNSVFSVAFSTDGRKLVSASEDRTARIWDVQSGAQIGPPLKAHKGAVHCAAFSTDGTKIVTGSNDKTIRLWDAGSGIQLGEPLVGHEGAIWSTIFSPNGDQIVSASDDKTLRIWDAKCGTPIGEPLRGHSVWVRCAGFSSDGSQIVSASDDKSVRIWDTNSRVQIGEAFAGHDDCVRYAAFSLDGRTVVSASFDKTVRIWDVRLGVPIGEPIRGHAGRVQCAVFSPDGTTIASASEDRTVRIWRVCDGIQVGDSFKGHDDCVYSVAFSPNGSKIASTSDDETLRIWDIFPVNAKPSHAYTSGHEHHVQFAIFSPDGTKIVSASTDNTLRLWDFASGAQIGHPLLGHEDSVYTARFSPDGSKIVTASNDKTVRIWDVESRMQIGEPLRAHDTTVWSAIFSPDGSQIVSTSIDGVIRFWDVESREQIGDALQGHLQSCSSISFSPDGARFVSASDDKTAQIWDSRTRARIGKPLRGHDHFVRSASFSPDGRTIVTGSFDNTVRLWDAETSIQIGEPLRGHSDWAPSVAFSPDGTKIVSASSDKTLRVWDVKSRAQIGMPLQGHPDVVTSAVFSPDGNSIVSSSHDRSIRIWNVLALESKSLSEPSSNPWNLPVNFDSVSGWVIGERGEYLLWVPQAHRKDKLSWLHVHSRVLGLPELRVEAEGSFHGEKWAHIYTDSES